MTLEDLKSRTSMGELQSFLNQNFKPDLMSGLLNSQCIFPFGPIGTNLYNTLQYVFQDWPHSDQDNGNTFEINGPVRKNGSCNHPIETPIPVYTFLESCLPRKAAIKQHR